MTRMNFAEEFEKMRPYHDGEVNPAIRRLVSYPPFRAVIGYLYPGQPFGEVVEKLLKINTVSDFQTRFMHYAVWQVVKKTSSGLTVGGLDNLVPGKACLFVSNHRDIVMDAALLQIILVDQNLPTSQITFGSNLMSSPFIVDFGRLNRMFTFYRDGSKIRMYRHALLHSEYIRNAVVNLNESLWIAQHSGRTKDGNDYTQPALLKMFIGRRPDPLSALRELNIVPVAVSYQVEPCDLEKVREMYLSARQEYVKEKDEDFQSVLNGIISPKGRIHFNFGTPVNGFLDELADRMMDTGELCDTLAAHIDKEIHHLYHLNPENFAASDMLSGRPEFSSEYSPEDFHRFAGYVEEKTGRIEGDKAELTGLFLRMYAGPVRNRFKY